ncbi:hypothetical protein R6Z07M_008779 [Ovis aries]
MSSPRRHGSIFKQLQLCGIQATDDGRLKGLEPLCEVQLCTDGWGSGGERRASPVVTEGSPAADSGVSSPPGTQSQGSVPVCGVRSPMGPTAERL